jgi:predicted DNA-binding protein
MVRTEIYLTEEQKKALTTLAYADSSKSNRRISMADLIRKAIDSYINTRSDFPLVKEATLLSQSDSLKRIIYKSLKEIEDGKTRSAQEFIDELGL